MAPQLNLLVLRCADIDAAVKFYELLGLAFESHVHGQGDPHYAAQMGVGVLELYPATHKRPVTSSTRLGFAVEDVDGLVARIEAANYRVVTPPADSPWGRRAVVHDLDGHMVELVSKQ